MPFNPSEFNNSDATGSQAPPPGVYEVEVLEADAFVSRKDDRAFSKLTYRILTGDLTGHCFDQIGILEGPGLFYTKGRLAMLGYDITKPVADIYALADALSKQLKGVEATVRVEPGQGPYPNIEVLQAKPKNASQDIPVPDGDPPPPVKKGELDEQGDPIPF